MALRISYLLCDFTAHKWKDKDLKSGISLPKPLYMTVVVFKLFVAMKSVVSRKSYMEGQISASHSLKIPATHWTDFHQRKHKSEALGEPLENLLDSQSLVLEYTGIFWDILEYSGKVYINGNVPFYTVHIIVISPVTLEMWLV